MVHQPPIVETTHHPAPVPANATSPASAARKRTLAWATEDDTAATARALAACPQVAHAVVALQGDLGAGKTTLVRHLLRALGVQGRIKSPTYAVVEPHQASLNGAPLAVWHFDFYRFDDPREYEDAGFRDVFASPGLKLAEWPDKVGAYLPVPDLTVHIRLADDGSRCVTLTAATAHGSAWLAAMDAPLPGPASAAAASTAPTSPTAPTP